LHDALPGKRLCDSPFYSRGGARHTVKGWRPRKFDCSLSSGTRCDTPRGVAGTLN
jgi:hypothetical protein